MIQSVYLLHGWDGTPNGAWKPWLKKELEIRGLEVMCPQLPHADIPMIDEWVPFLEKTVTSEPAATCIVAHSLSAPAVLMFLERQPKNARFAKVIFVGAVYRKIDTLDAAGEQIARPWLTHTYDAPHIRTVAPNITAFFSDDDPLIPLETGDSMHTDFGVRAITDHACGHYNSTEYPQFLEEIIKSVI
jgi:uncharacterized protein